MGNFTGNAPQHEPRILPVVGSAQCQGAPHDCHGAGVTRDKLTAFASATPERIAWELAEELSNALTRVHCRGPSQLRRRTKVLEEAERTDAKPARDPPAECKGRKCDGMHIGACSGPRQKLDRLDGMRFQRR